MGGGWTKEITVIFCSHIIKDDSHYCNSCPHTLPVQFHSHCPRDITHTHAQSTHREHTQQCGHLPIWQKMVNNKQQILRWQSLSFKKRDKWLSSSLAQPASPWSRSYKIDRWMAIGVSFLFKYISMVLIKYLNECAWKCCSLVGWQPFPFCRSDLNVPL